MYVWYGEYTHNASVRDVCSLPSSRPMSGKVPVGQLCWQPEDLSGYSVSYSCANTPDYYEPGYTVYNSTNCRFRLIWLWSRWLQLRRVIEGVYCAAEGSERAANRRLPQLVLGRGAGGSGHKMALQCAPALCYLSPKPRTRPETAASRTQLSRTWHNYKRGFVVMSEQADASGLSGCVNAVNTGQTFPHRSTN